LLRNSQIASQNSGVTAPSVLLKVEPEYSDLARGVRGEGRVVLSMTIDEGGVPRAIKVARSLSLPLDQRAIEAVEKWRFRPGMKDGKPVAAQASIEVRFRPI